MIPNNLDGKAALITGGTKGLGVAIGLALAGEGAHVYLTHKWGSADEEQIRRRFSERGARSPEIVDADAASREDTVSLLTRIKAHHDTIEVFVSNASFAQVGSRLEELKKRYLFKSLEYSAWPMVGYVQQIKEIFGRYPRYTLGTSCDGPDTYYPGYGYVAVCKTVMETFCRYMAKHIYEEEQSTVNIIRSRPVSTESLVATFGDQFEPFLKKYYGEDYFIEADAVGEAALAIVSGLMDAMNGQVILLDKGAAFQDNLMRLFEDREQYNLQ